MCNNSKNKNTQKHGIIVYRVMVRYEHYTDKVLQHGLLLTDKDRKGAVHVSIIRGRDRTGGSPADERHCRLM